ncbi:MAG: hypothetical protein NZ556_08850 [Fimbriimonadales bacterium]|nr:hypothetical protein [Fimbriimonadales bacterium]
MRRRAWLPIGVLIVATAILLLLANRAAQPPTITLESGVRITYLGMTHGRVHTLSRWHYQWAWPPIQRQLLHIPDTPINQIVLWFRVKQPLMRSEWYEFRCAPRPDVLLAGKIVGNFPNEIRNPDIEDTVVAVMFPTLQADGSTVQVGVDTANRPRLFPVRLPKDPILQRMPQPEPLPATRQLSKLKVTLHRAQWINARDVLGDAFDRWLMLDYQLELSNPEWTIYGAEVVEVGANAPICFDGVARGVREEHYAMALGELRGSVAQLLVRLHHPSGAVEYARFYIAPPTPHERRRLGIDAP